MKRKIFHKQFLTELLISSVSVATLHLVALYFSLYWIIEWFDILMHFIGGITIGFLATFMFFSSGYIKSISEFKHNKVILFSFIFMFTAIVALAWEIWEVFFGISDVLIDRNDTVADLIMGMLGSVFVYYYVKDKIK